MTRDLPRFAITLALALSAAISAGGATAEIRTGASRALSELVDEKRREVLRDRHEARFRDLTDADTFCEMIVGEARGALRRDLLEACAKVRVEGEGQQVSITRGPSTVFATGGGRVCSVVGEVGRAC